jgi:hypothetical protein
LELFQNTLEPQLEECSKQINEFRTALANETNERICGYTVLRNLVTPLRAVCVKNFARIWEILEEEAELKVAAEVRQECLVC